MASMLAISLVASAINVGVVYTAINQGHLNYLQMLGLLVVVTFVGSFLTREIVPPSEAVKKVGALMKGHSSSLYIGEIAITDIISLAATVAIAYMLWTRFGGLRWFGIYVATTIAALIPYFA